MRISEKFSLLRKVTKENGSLYVKSERTPDRDIKVLNYEEIIKAIELLNDQEWNSVSIDRIRDIIKKYGLEGTPVLAQHEYEWMNEYIARVNEKYPLYFSMLSAEMYEEDEYGLSILIPAKVDFFSDLMSFNKDLTIIFDSLKITNDIKFISFDKGTDWYVIATRSASAYYLFMTCLGTAQGLLDLKKTYYESEIAKHQYETIKMIQPNLDLTEEQLYQQTLDRVIENKVKEGFSKEILQGFSKRGTEEELLAGIRKAIGKLASILEQGSQIQPSANHPKFLTTENGNITINITEYNSIEPEEENPPLLEEGINSAQNE